MSIRGCGGWSRGGYFWKGETKYCLGRAKKNEKNRRVQIVRFRDDFEGSMKGSMMQMMHIFLADVTGYIHVF